MSEEKKPAPEDTEVEPTKPIEKAEVPVEPTKPVDAAPPPDSSDPVTAKLKEVGIADDAIGKIKALGAETVDDLSNLVETDLTGVGVPILKARKVVASLATPVAPAAPATNAEVNFDTILPTVPDDTSWLNSLRAGGVLKIEDSTVMSAIRVALADRFNFYAIPKKLVGAMEKLVDVTEDQVGEEFWRIRKQLTRKAYGDLFAAIDGLDGSFVTDARKNELLARINDHDTGVWAAVTAFNRQLVAWREAWMQGSVDPMMMVAAIGAAAGGGAMPPGMMQPPDCGVLRDASEAVNDSLNRIFRGTGVQITAALAFEANEIKKMLGNSRLPMLCGIPTRELLLKKLKVTVPATYPRMEQNLTRFIMAILQVDKVASGDEELRYFGTLYMLGSQIPWEDLGQDGMTGERPKGIGRSNDPFKVEGV